jgi:OOP family OmpA-OmpF porin
MKKITKISAAVLASLALVGLANAASPGAYVGLGMGGSTVRTPDSYLFQSNNGFDRFTNEHQHGGLGGKIFAGFNFNQYFGLEAAYATYAKSSYKASTNGTSATLKDSLTAFSVVGKAYLPIEATGFNVYVLGGVAEVRNQVNYSNSGVALAQGVSAKYKSGNHLYSDLRPVFGVGANYEVAHNVTTGLEFSRIQGKGNFKTSPSAIPTADMLSLNIGYNFG